MQSRKHRIDLSRSTAECRYLCKCGFSPRPLHDLHQCMHGSWLQSISGVLVSDKCQIEVASLSSTDEVLAGSRTMWIAALLVVTSQYHSLFVDGSSCRGQMQEHRASHPCFRRCLTHRVLAWAMLLPCELVKSSIDRLGLRRRCLSRHVADTGSARVLITGFCM